MDASRRWWRRAVVVSAAASVSLASASLSAQAPTSPGSTPGFLSSGAATDETSPSLLLGPRGEVLRLWQRRADPKEGGGAVILSTLSGTGTWSTLVEIRSPEKGVTIRDPEVATSGSDQVALIYRWWRDRPRAKHLRLARSDDGGKNWALPDTPIDTSGKAFDPSIAWAGGKSLVAVWADERRGNRVFDIYARRSPDAGSTWGPEQLLSRFPEVLRTDLFARPQLVSDGRGRLWVAWVGVKNGRSSLFVNRSLDGGQTWTEPTPVTGNSQSVYRQSLLRAGERMLLVWADTRTGRDRLYAVSSGDAGATWTIPVRVDHLPDGSEAETTSPSASLSPDGEVLVAWQDARNGRDDIFLARSTDGGRTWGAEDRRMDMDDAGTGVSRYPRLARAEDGRVALAWDDDRAGFESVYVRVRSAGDKPEWGPEVRVSSPAPKLAARLPQLLWAPDGVLHVAWEVWDHTVAPSVTKRVDGKALPLKRSE